MPRLLSGRRFARGAATGVLALGGLFASRAAADVKLPAIISDNMCLQADHVLPIWGWASPGEKVSVSFGGASEQTVADDQGKWHVKLAAMKANPTPGELSVKGNNQLTVKNVVIGEVWAASGQSNMEFGLGGAHNAGTEIPKANHPLMRLFTVKKAVAFTPQDDCVGKWEECTPETAGHFSAVAYFFGRDLHAALNVPVGMIHTSWGGTPAQAWTRLEVLEKTPELAGYAESFHKVADHLDAEKERYAKELLPKFEADRKKWEATYGAPFAAKMKAWNAEAKAAQAANKPLPPKPLPEKPEPRRPNSPDMNPGLGSVLYNGMIAPIVPYAMRGAIWYQGESNAGQPDQLRGAVSGDDRELASRLGGEGRARRRRSSRSCSCNWPISWATARHAERIRTGPGCARHRRRR